MTDNEKLAEARAEVERLKVIKWVQTESYEAVAAVQQARQEAARECVQILRGYSDTKGIGNVVMKRFGLEGMNIEQTDMNDNKPLHCVHGFKTDCPYCEIDRLKGELEQTRVQLAGCGVAALCNTRESMTKQIVGPDAYGYSASYQDVLNAVGREINLREMNKDLEQQLASARAGVKNLEEKDFDSVKERDAAYDLGFKDACAERLGDIAQARKEAAREILHIISMETMDRPFEQSQAVEIIKTRFKLEG